MSRHWFDYCLREAGKLKRVTMEWISKGYSERKAANLRREALERLARGDEIVREQAEKLILNAAANAYMIWLEGEGKHVKQERNRYEVHIRDIFGYLPVSTSHVDR